MSRQPVRPQAHTQRAREILELVEPKLDVLPDLSDRDLAEMQLAAAVAQVHATLGATR